MKSKKIKDERVLQLNNKIQSEAYIIVLFLTIVSVFIKSYVMDMPFLQYAVEIGIIIQTQHLDMVLKIHSSHLTSSCLGVKKELLNQCSRLKSSTVLSFFYDSLLKKAMLITITIQFLRSVSLKSCLCVTFWV
ncbi:DUF6773 family protein [Clostridium algidicarnis]|uniref:DUF6773 family protein n=1 Tax=Clostridium algidicarnis TaxID=37659 RepID=UPI00311AA0FC